MPQSGFTPIITYNTATASAAPSAGNLTQGELAVNVTDKKIYTKNSGGSVVQVGSGPDATETLTNKTLTSPDINGGTIDGTVIGGATPAAGSFTTLSASGGVVGAGFKTAEAGFETGKFYRDTTFGTIVSGSSGASKDLTLTLASGATALSIANTGAVTIPGSVTAGALTVASTATGGFSVVDLTTNGNDWEIGAGGSSSSKANSFYIQDITNSAFRFVIDPNGASTFNSGTFGYGAGAGGTVTQATSKSTAVTLNKPCGQITMNNAALAANTFAVFQLSNSFIAATDIVNVCANINTSGAYEAWAYYVTSGLCLIAVRNNNSTSLSDALVINFSVIKGAAS